MAILDFDKDNDKSISFHFHSPEMGPENQPLYYSTPEQPAVITGHVEFRSVKPTNGSDITISFEARAESKWTEHYGQSSASFHQISRFQEKTWNAPLNRTNPKTIAPGVTRYDFEVQLDPGLPPSIHGQRGWFHYRFKAHIKRDFPRRDMAVKQLAWVYSSSIRADEQPQPRLYREVFNDVMPFSCTLPSNVLYQEQYVPLTIQFEPFRDNSIFKDQKLIVMSACVKLKQYTTLMERHKLFTKKRKEKKDIFSLSIPTTEWPQTSQGFTKTITVKLPGARQLAASIESDPLIKRHCLKLIMMVRTNTIAERDAKELRIEMDVKVTSPRPEHLQDTRQHDDSTFIAPPPYQDLDSDDDVQSDSKPPPFRRSSSSSSDSRSFKDFSADIKDPSGL